MYCSYLRDERRGTRSRTLACVLVLSLGYGWMQAAADVLPATVPAGANLAPVDLHSHLRLLQTAAGGLGAEEDCDPLPSAASAPGGELLLARADTDLAGARSVRAAPRAGSVALVEAAPQAAVAVPVALPAGRDWEINIADKTLNNTLARWAASTGWQLLWELPVDYAVEAHTRLHGTFEEAVAVVARSMEAAEIPMKAVFYQGNKVLRIMAKGSE
ncbi:MAG: toxin [Alcaligenaceae bacterium]|nr:toxin [Alcaligenaceae bacterium SAGV5]MPS55007.1 toxin [Alcaligenaceae bacterium SAGV3]MPT55601.1 toxin [Alcaligenaceae bacterium]